MTVIVHENKKLSSLPTLMETQDIINELSMGTDKLSKEEFIRIALEKYPKFDAWSPLVYYRTDGTVLETDLILVSLRGAIAYKMGGDLHINYGDLESGSPQVSVNILGDQHTLQLGRAVASTFLTVPDIYKGIKEADLQVIHLDGQSHQCHILNLEWKLNKPEADTDLVEKTVKVLNADLPTEE
ncbi:HNH homing endonuclease [Erwinia phage AH04]|uniref:HNH homing endonuclease n=1 Tax=Erwinia phage AH04 TaxID=2869569 RepID=A0AAE8BQ32_9CAUD|nr:HNH endonuclease [Erwinia phage AH04]QZA70574.1 HNH homing endonuclease [Erwinia phage AH04]